MPSEDLDEERLELERKLLNELPPSEKARFTPGSTIGTGKPRLTMAVLHDRFCHLLAAEIHHYEAYRLAGYSTSGPQRGWQSNAVRVLRMKSTQEKLDRFRGGNYSFMSEDLSPDAILTTMKNYAVCAEKAGDFRGAAAIMEKIAQQAHGMFLSSKKPQGPKDLSETLKMATSDEIRQALDNLDHAEGNPELEEDLEPETVM